MTRRTRAAGRSLTWLRRAQSSGGRSSPICRLTELMRRLLSFSVLVSIQFCATCARQRPEAEYRPTTTIKDLMDGIVDSAADTIWDSASACNIKSERSVVRGDEHDRRHRCTHSFAVLPAPQGWHTFASARRWQPASASPSRKLG